MEDRSVRLGLIFTIIVLFIGASISPSISGNIEKIGNKSVSNFPINCSTSNAGLLAYWSFDEGNGNIANDYSGNGYHGSIFGATWTTGYSGSALDFDGDLDYVDLNLYSEDLGFNKTDDYKISAWINSESTDSGVIYMISYMDLIPVFYIKLKSDGTLQMKVQSTTTCEIIINSTESYNDGVWRYIEAIYYGSTSNPTIELYVDGELAGSGSDWLCPMASFQFKKAKIGMVSYDEIEFFNGKIDELKVFKIPGGNQPPNAPIISGPTSGIVSDDYNYTFIATDKEGDDLYLWIDWGDGSDTGWIGPYSSGEEVKLSPSWSEKGAYTIQAKAKDMRDAESDWSDHFIVAITEKSFIMGFITNMSVNGELTSFNAKLLIYIGLQPLSMKFYLSGEEIIISNENTGMTGKRYIIGIFNAVVI